jgi:hypothetical protein
MTIDRRDACPSRLSTAIDRPDVGPSRFSTALEVQTTRTHSSTLLSNVHWSAAMTGRTVAHVIAMAGALTSISPTAARAEEDDKAALEHTIILGVGGAGELELRDGSFHPGVNSMVEWEAIENWLELEVEASILAADHGVEIPIGVLAKKPFRLTRWAELMIGIGPEVVRVSNPTTKGTYFGGQLALDFMLWPSQHVGGWVEPSYDLTFRDGVSHGIGTTGGLLLGW